MNTKDLDIKQEMNRTYLDDEYTDVNKSNKAKQVP